MDNLKPYASFLLNNHLDEVTRLGIRLSREAKIPLLELFSNLSEEELFKLSKQGQEQFLKEVIEGNAYESAIQNLWAWKENKLPGISKEKISLTDLVLGYSLRKDQYNHFLPLYTNDVKVALAVVEGLERFDREIEKEAYKIYLEIQQEDLRKEKDFTLSLIENSIDGIFAFDRDLKITAFNSQLAQRYKLDASYFIGKKIFEAFPYYEKTEEGAALQRVLNGERIFIAERPYHSLPGYYEVNMIPLYNQQGEVTGGFSILHDITERKKSESLLQEQKEELAANNEELLAVNEELQAQREELQVANEELQAAILEREEIEQALKDSESKFRLLAENSSDVIAKYTVQGVCTYATPASETVFGYTPQEMEGLNIFSHAHPVDVEELKKTCDTVTKHKDAVNFCYRFRCKDGLYKWVECTAKAVWNDSQSSAIEINTATRDITKRKLAEDKLIKNEMLLSEAQSIAHLGSWEWDIPQDEIIWSDETYKIFGRTRTNEKLSLDDYLNYVTPAEERQKLMGLIMETISEKRTYTLQHRIISKTGTTRWILSKGRVIAEENGKVTKLAGIIFDITDLKKTEEELQKSQAQLQIMNNELEQRVDKRTTEAKRLAEEFIFLAESIPQLVWTTGAEGGIEYVNQKMKDYTGRKDPDDFSPAPDVHKDDVERVMDAWKKSSETGNPLNIEFRFRRYDGIYRWFLVRALPLKDKEGKIVKWFGTSTDIHDQKVAEESVRKQNQELNKINTDLDNFIYTASHDLKAPISNVEGLINTLFSEIELPKDLIHLKELIYKSIEKFRNTIKDLTEVSKVQKETGEDVELINFAELMSETTENIHDLIEKSGATISTSFETPDLLFSKKNIRSILYNLISNAVKYSSPDRKPVIKVSAKKDGEFIQLAVADNGLGIKASQKDKVFIMFKRLHDHVEGTGIGLYIVKRIVENSGGKIEVESEEGKGSVFRLWLKPQKKIVAVS